MFTEIIACTMKMTGIKKFFGLIIILAPLLLIPTILFGGETDKKPESISKIQGNYVLRVKGEHISLKAKDASLKDILEEIGRRMQIEVVANIPREEKITIELDMMYLEDALKRFKTNYAYITRSEKEKGKITQIVVVPENTKELPPINWYQTQQDSQPSELIGITLNRLYKSLSMNLNRPADRWILTVYSNNLSRTPSRSGSRTTDLNLPMLDLNITLKSLSLDLRTTLKPLMLDLSITLNRLYIEEK